MTTEVSSALTNERTGVSVSDQSEAGTETTLSVLSHDRWSLSLLHSAGRRLWWGLSFNIKTYSNHPSSRLQKKSSSIIDKLRFTTNEIYSTWLFIIRISETFFCLDAFPAWFFDTRFQEDFEGLNWKMLPGWMMILSLTSLFDQELHQKLFSQNLVENKETIKNKL